MIQKNMFMLYIIVWQDDTSMWAESGERIGRKYSKFLILILDVIGEISNTLGIFYIRPK